MKQILFVFLLGIFLVGCGTGEQGTGENPEGNGDTNGSGSETPGVSVTLEEESPLVYNYQITNVSDEDLTFEFTSSQRFDFSVQTKEGEEVFLFSSVASFMQVLGEETIEPGDTLEYKIELNDLNLEPGEYVLNAWLTPKDGKIYETSTEFTVE